MSGFWESFRHHLLQALRCIASRKCEAFRLHCYCNTTSLFWRRDVPQLARSITGLVLRRKQTHYDPFASIGHFLSHHYCFSMLFWFCLSILLSSLFRLVLQAQTQLGLNHWDPICHDQTLHIHRKIKIVQDSEIKRDVGIFRFLVVSQ